jgi:hypothetical protein
MLFGTTPKQAQDGANFVTIQELRIGFSNGLVGLVACQPMAGLPANGGPEGLELAELAPVLLP